MAKQLFGAILILLCTVCVTFAGEVEEQLKSNSQAWLNAFNAGDAKTLAKIYTSDGMLLPPNAEFVQGREAIEKYWAPFVKDFKGELETQEVRAQGDLAYTLGTFKIIDVNGKIVDRGKYLEIWKHQNGQWELDRDIWNTSLQTPEPEAK